MDDKIRTTIDRISQCEHLFVPSKFDDRQTWCVHCHQQRVWNYDQIASDPRTEEELIAKMTNHDIF